jgi:hypothetical protein
MAVNFVPLHDQILVRRVEEQETTRGGIIIPDTAKDKPQEGEVLAVGKGKIKEDGSPLYDHGVRKGGPMRKSTSKIIAASGPGGNIEAVRQQEQEDQGLDQLGLWR